MGAHNRRSMIVPNDGKQSTRTPCPISGSTVTIVLEKDIYKPSNEVSHLVGSHRPKISADQTLSDTSICSTAELIYVFLKKLKLGLSKESAIALYTGIITDSGSLKYDTVTEKTHLIDMIV